jgi:hypothetical protein
MKLDAHIQAIYLAASAGQPMHAIEQAQVNAGLGIAGDRYALGTGAYSDTEPSKVRHISIISLAGIEIANEWLKAGNEPLFDAADTRRNILLANITPDALNALVGQQFQIGDILMVGTELCTPCERPAKLLGRPSFMDAFEGRGGIRAKVLNSGALTVGDRLFLVDEK